MRIYWFSLFLLPFSFLLGVDSEKATLAQAEDFFAATLYREAIPLYCELQASSCEDFAKCRLGQVYYYEGKYQEAIECLSASNPDKLTPDALEDRTFFLALSYRQLRSYNHVIDVLEKQPLLAYQFERVFELGMACFMEGRLDQAHSLFHELDEVSSKEDLFILSRFYLARIALANQQPSDARALLDSLPVTLEGPLLGESLFLLGEISFQQQNFSQAIRYFEQTGVCVASKNNVSKGEIFYKLALSYLQLLRHDSRSVEDQRKIFKKIEAIFLELVNDSVNKDSKNERYSLALAQTYLLQGQMFTDQEAMKNAEQILIRSSGFTKGENHLRAMSLQGELALTYEARENIYRKMIAEANKNSEWLSKSWYLRGLNDLGEARKEKSERLFDTAAKAFKEAHQHATGKFAEFANLCLQYQIQSLWEKGTAGEIQALFVLQEALTNAPGNPVLEELHAARILQLAQKELPEKICKKIEDFLISSDCFDPASKRKLLLGAFYYKLGKYEQAVEAYNAFAEISVDAEMISYALLQAAFALEESGGNSEKARMLRSKIYENFPDASYAPLAYFISYTYQEYLQGIRPAIKHLRALKENFPNSPILLTANYLLGLDLKRDRYTAEKKSIQKKNPLKAIQAFSEVEADFSRLCEEQKMDKEEFDYYCRLRYYALLEKALIHFEVAAESSAAKKEIYLQYAVEALENLKSELDPEKNVQAAIFYRRELFPLLEQQCLYWLALAYKRAGQEVSSLQVFERMLAKYESAAIHTGYYLSCIYFELATIALEKNDASKALTLFLKAEEASKGKFLSVEEKLRVWIMQSECYKQMNQPENAMLVLSKVVNDDSISHLRLDAMLMRVELYERLGRPELARRQLESIAKLTGKWAEQAQEQLEKKYATP